MSSETSGPNPRQRLEEIFQWETDLYVLNPHLTYLHTLVDLATEAESEPTLRVLADRDVLSDLRDDFLMAGRAATLVERGSLELRESSQDEGTPIIVGEDVYAPLLVGGVGTIDSVCREEFCSRVTESMPDRWKLAEEFPLRTPPLREFVTAAGEQFGHGLQADLWMSLATADGIRERTEFDPVAALVIVAARHGLLHYEVSRWAETIGLASRATVSRRKQSLEAYDVVHTEPVETDTGAPRQRLSLDEGYADVVRRSSLDELVSRIAGRRT